MVINTQLKLEVNTLTEEYETFRNEYSVAHIDKENLEISDTATHDLTGLTTYKTFSYVASKATPSLAQGFETKMKRETQLVLTFTKLWLNIPDGVLSVVYSVSPEEIRSIYLSWITAIALGLEIDQSKKISDFKKKLLERDVNEPKCYYVGHIPMLKMEPKLGCHSRTAWIRDLPPENEFITEHAVCIVADNGLVIYISPLVGENRPLMPILQEAKVFIDLLTDSDKIYLLQSEQVVQKKDIELGVALDMDDEKHTPCDQSFSYCRQLLKNVNEFQVLSDGNLSFNENMQNLTIKACVLASSVYLYNAANTSNFGIVTVGQN